jgi:hypothetical protein
MSGKADLNSANRTLERELQWMEKLGHGEATSGDFQDTPVNCDEVRDHFARLSSAFATVKQAGAAGTEERGARITTGRIQQLEKGIKALGNATKQLRQGFLEPEQQRQFFENAVNQLPSRTPKGRTDYGTFET